MIQLRGMLVALTVIAAGMGCGEATSSPNPPPPPPPPGSGAVSLTTPNTDDGAVFVTLRGPGLTTLRATDSSHVFYSRLVGDSAARVILVGNLGAGPLFTFKLGSGAALSDYTAMVQQVATRADALRGDTSGYLLTVTPRP